jgi:general secretion pathway protein F
VPMFHYTALSTDGAPLEGDMEAISSDAVINRLNELGHLPIRAEPISAIAGHGGAHKFPWRHGVNKVRLGLLTRELSRLISAGVPLERSLEILAGVAESKEVEMLLNNILNSIRGGMTLADAMNAHGRPFDRLYVNMIRAGEAGGALDDVLAGLSDYMSRSRELNANVVSALTYPIILLAVSVLSIALLLTFVVPQFEALFEGAGAALPLPTRIVIELARWFQEFWWFPLVVLLVLLVTGPRILRRSGPRLIWDRFILSLPKFGTLVRKREVIIFCRTLGTLLANGVSMLEALSVVGETHSNAVMAKSVRAIMNSLKAGEGLASPLATEDEFPRLMVDMVRVGEEAGNLDSMLIEIADIYDKEVQQSIKTMLALLEPIMILTLGVIIGGIIISIFVAILSVNELAF